jgi:hypothetical protein
LPLLKQKGMTQRAVQFFQSKGIAVMFSIGGEVFSSNGRWNSALADPVQLAKNAAAISKTFGVKAYLLVIITF